MAQELNIGQDEEEEENEERIVKVTIRLNTLEILIYAVKYFSSRSP